ncbi:hypothetical protein [Knoellia subterranea]|uniref:carboxylate--amine ligase n=1 Tax=Knoellia subterranea TaxID=184882 RepID=UPI001FDEC139|nr:hypothetical protein [Knoellia subterranea]
MSRSGNGAVGTERFTPLIVGGDIGAYSLARSFHDGHGMRSVVVSRLAGWHVADSAIIDHVLCEDPGDPEVLVDTLRSIAAQRPGERFLLLGSADAAVTSIVRIRDELKGLDSRWVAPYVGMEQLRAGTEKQNFARLCEDLDVGHPRTVTIDLGSSGDLDVDLPFGFPIVVKPAVGSRWKEAPFPGQKKVHVVGSRDEAIALVNRARASGYDHHLVLQEFIPGDDQGMRILTCYCDSDSRIRFASWGRTLLEEHTPGALGNPAAILTGVNPEAVEQAQRICSRLGWTGYANFDLKVDPRDGRTLFLELNPRLGRSNGYIEAAGRNPVSWYVRDHFDGGLGDEPGAVVQAQREALYTVVPLSLVKHYTTLPDARAALDRVLATGAVLNPLINPRVEHSPRRWAHIAAAMANYVLKFRRHYQPAPAGTQSRVWA